MSIIQAPGQANIWDAQAQANLAAKAAEKMDGMAEEDDESTSTAPSPVATPASLAPAESSPPAAAPAAASAAAAAAPMASAEKEVAKKKEKIVRLSSCAVM